MRTDDDGASRLQRDENLVDRGRRRIGRRHDRGDDAERLGDLDDLAIFEPLQHADRPHRPDEPVHAIGGKLILLDLVGDDAESGFLDRELRERFALRRHGGSHRVDDGVDALLRELRNFHLRLLARGARACAPPPSKRDRDRMFWKREPVEDSPCPAPVRSWAESFRLRRAAAE